MTSSTAVWEFLVRSDREVVTTGDLEDLARRVGLRPEHVARHLRREGLILPLFKGFYYVRRPDEVRLGDDRYNALELFAMAAGAKRIGRWYFGLETALRLNGMTHEDSGLEWVITESMYRIEPIAVGRRRFVAHKWAPRLLRFGLVKRGPYPYSDPEKTVLDLAYLDAWKHRKGKPTANVWMEHIESVDGHTLRRYLRNYPPMVTEILEAGR